MSSKSRERAVSDPGSRRQNKKYTHHFYSKLTEKYKQNPFQSFGIVYTFWCSHEALLPTQVSAVKGYSGRERCGRSRVRVP